MQKAQAAYKELTGEWTELIEHIKTSKPEDLKLVQFGYADIELTDLEIPWISWETAINVSDLPVDFIYESKLVALFNSMRDQLRGAKANGVGWLLNSSPFLNDCRETSQITFVLMPALRQDLMDFEKYKIPSSLIASGEITEIKKRAEDALSKVSENEAKVSSYAGQVETINKILDEAQAKLTDATEKIKKATADLNKQGLSEAFASTAKAFSDQRKYYIGGFFLSISGLLYVGYENKQAFSTIGQSWAALGGAALAAPLVWFGWFCVRQVGLLTRLQQDYEYKTATALAFEAHKKEVLLTDGVEGDLSKRLIDTVIKNFGDNPVRLIEVLKSNHGHPFEEFLSKIKDDKNVEKIVKTILEAKGKE